MPRRPITRPLPHTSATALTIAPPLAQIRVLRARKPLPFYGYPIDLQSATDRIVPAVLLLCAVSYWFIVTSPAALSAV